MSADATFRTVLLVSFAVAFPIALYFRVKSQSTGEPLDRRQEGWFILITLRLTGIVSWVGMIAYLIRPAWMA